MGWRLGSGFSWRAVKAATTAAAQEAVAPSFRLDDSPDLAGGSSTLCSRRARVAVCAVSTKAETINKTRRCKATAQCLPSEGNCLYKNRVRLFC